MEEFSPMKREANVYWYSVHYVPTLRTAMVSVFDAGR